MSNRFVLASVGTVQFFDQSSGDLIVTSKTLVDSGINFSVTAEDIRGGMANALLSQYFHDSAMGLTLTDALFSLEYLALNVGGTIQAGADVLTVEQVTTAEANKITVSETPQKFGNFGVIGWYSVVGEDNWTKITFDPETKTASAPDLPLGTTVCVKYTKTDASAEQFVVSSAFIPAQVYGVLTLPLFKAGTESKQFSNSSKVGEVQVVIPNFIFSGAMDLSLTASGATTTPLSGNALVTFTGLEGCDSNEGYYAYVKQVTYNKDEFADVKAIVVADANLELKATETQTLQVYAIYSGIKAPKLIDNSKLTFTSSNDTYASVDAKGVVTANAQGSATIEIFVKTKNSLQTAAVVTVEA